MNDFLVYDEQLFLYLNNLGSSGFDSFWVFISAKWSWIPLYALFLYLLYVNFGVKKTVYVLVFIILGLIVSDQVSVVFKNEIMRLRPCHDEGLIPHMRVVQCGGKYGFYSSHASNTFMLASFLNILMSKKYKYFSVLIFAWAGIVSYSRIYLGVHFPLDILVGGTMGYGIGSIVAFISKLNINKIN